MLAPNACLEAVSVVKPVSVESLAEIPEIKQWFAESFGQEILDVLETEDQDKGDGGEEAKPRKRSASAKKRRRRKSARSKTSSEQGEPAPADPEK